jgi:hypothetical protein
MVGAVQVGLRAFKDPPFYRKCLRRSMRVPPFSSELPCTTCQWIHTHP